jgi:peptidylprolyl isomerase
MAADKGQTVLFHYTGRYADGTVFESSNGRGPLRATLGQGQIIRPVDEALTGMNPGEERTIAVAAEDAYGPRRPELIQEVERQKIPAEVDLTVGNRVGAVGQDGKQLELTVVEVKDDTVTLDANHPLAGRDLTFELTLVEAA